MPPIARITAAVIGIITVLCGLALARIANSWRRADRERDEGKPFLQQERFYRFTRMNTVWSARKLTWMIVLAGAILIIWSVADIG